MANNVKSQLNQLASFIPPKSFLESSTIGGISLLTIGLGVDILVTDPISLSGLIKTIILISGTTLSTKGRFSAIQPIDLSFKINRSYKKEGLPYAIIDDPKPPVSPQEPATVDKESQP